MKRLLFWLLRIIPAAILFQTLFFKFTAAPESVYIFSTLGLGDAGRIGSGIIELIAAILLLIPKSSHWGALIAMCTMAGAIVSHIFVLGIAVQGDGGLLFRLAIITFICCNIIISQNINKFYKFIQNQITMLQFTVNKNIDELIYLLERLDTKSYQQPIASLSNASIGGHTRHIIEMYLCLIEGYKSGIVNYDARKRDKIIELSAGNSYKQTYRY